MSYPNINVNEINVGGVGSIYVKDGGIEISNFNGGGAGTGPTGPTGPAGHGGGGSSTIYSGMLNMVSGNTGTLTRAIPTDPLTLPLFADDSDVQSLLDLTPYFDTNTNVITINTSVSLTMASGSSFGEYIYFYAQCNTQPDGSGSSLTPTNTLTIVTKSEGLSGNDRIIPPININLVKNTNFDTSHPYLQIYLSKTNISGAFLVKMASDTVPVTILSL